MPCISKQPYKYIIYTHVYHTYWHILPIYILCKITNIYICTNNIYIYIYIPTYPVPLLVPGQIRANNASMLQHCGINLALIASWNTGRFLCALGILMKEHPLLSWWSGLSWCPTLWLLGYVSIFKKQKSQVAFRGNKLVELSWLASCTFLPILRSEQCWKMVSWSCWYNWTSWKLTGQIC